MWHIKLELIKQDKWPGRNSPSKWLEYFFHNSAHDNRNWDKIYDNLRKKIVFQTECISLWEEKNNHKPSPSINIIAHRSSIYYSKMCLEKSGKKVNNSSGPTKNKTSQAPSSALHIWKGRLGILDRYSTEFFKNWMDSKITEFNQFATKTKALGK